MSRPVLLDLFACEGGAGDLMGGVDWMTRRSLSEAIPPAYTEHLGAQLLDALVVAA